MSARRRASCASTHALVAWLTLTRRRSRVERPRSSPSAARARRTPSGCSKSAKPKRLRAPLSGSRTRFHERRAPQSSRRSRTRSSSASGGILPTYAVVASDSGAAGGGGGGGTGREGAAGSEPPTATAPAAGGGAGGGGGGGGSMAPRPAARAVPDRAPRARTETSETSETSEPRAGECRGGEIARARSDGKVQRRARTVVDSLARSIPLARGRQIKSPPGEDSADW